MNILFICKYNRFRSKVAEALFHHYNNQKNIHIKSAGILKDLFNPKMAPSVCSVLKKRKIRVKDVMSHLIDKRIIEWADKIIISADNVSIDNFPKEKVGIWSIKDAEATDLDQIKETIEKIEVKIKELIKKIQQTK